MPSTPPFGTWPSPLTPELVTSGSVKGLTEPIPTQGHLYWLETRPSDKGRTVLCCEHGGARYELEAPWSVRSRVHEYGGGAYTASGDTAYFVDDATQRVWKWARGHDPAPLSPEPASPRGVRWADLELHPGGRWLLAVRETHPTGGSGGLQGVRNELVALATDGSGTERILAAGRDFYSSGRFSPDGALVAWVCWDHPHMPWEQSEVWVGSVGEDMGVASPRAVEAGDGVSAGQPLFSDQGELHFISDRSGWSNLYLSTEDGPLALGAEREDYGSPHWVFGDPSYAFVEDGIVAIGSRGGTNRLVHIGRTRAGLDSGQRQAPTHIPLEGISVMSHPRSAGGGRITITAGGPRSPSAIAVVPLVDRPAESPTSGIEVIAGSMDGLSLGPQWWSAPQAITCPSARRRETHALFYPPHNPDVSGGDGGLPPLIVVSHGGPTSAARPILDLRGVQFFTSRGFAVAQVDYAGSWGYGRAYREALDGAWGVADVEDCVAVATWLADQGLVDRSRLIAKGGSAGGFTTLCALVSTDLFAAGTSYYGVADPSMLARDTHKFESHYLDRLIGPWPAAREVYEQRSPVLHADQISAPVILFQGLDDAVVPPSQSAAIAQALEEKGIPHRLVTFEGEGHGFRRAETLKRCLEAELAFYHEVFGLLP